MVATEQRQSAKSERIAVRVTPAVKERVERAAGLVGRSVSDFTTEAVQERADAVIRDQRAMELSDRDMDALLAALENPPEPNQATLRAMARRRARIVSDR